jgi:beta-lactamase regulating signal transducer with metallopeptidase domain
MTGLESLLIGLYLLNAAWQLPLLAGFALLLLRCLRRPSPKLESAVWTLVAMLAALLPLAVVLGVFGPVHFSSGSAGPVAQQGFLLQLLLLIPAFVTLRTLIRLLRAAIATVRLRRRTRAAFHRAGVEIRISPPEYEAAGPLLTGVLRPVIFIPAFLTKAEHAPLLDAAIAHELAHVARHDMFTYCVTEMFLLPLAFHPLTGWLRQKLYAARELACDARATVDSVAYARCLLAMARHTVQPARQLAALGIGNAQILEQRIHALASPSTRTLSLRERYLAAVLLLIACASLAVAARSTYLWFTSIPAPVYRTLGSHPPPPPPPPLPSRR